MNAPENAPDIAPVDPADLQRAAAGARKFFHEIDGATLAMLCPTRYERTRLVGLAKGDETQQLRNVVETAIIGWQGVTVGHAMPDHKRADEQLPFDRVSLGLVLDDRPQWLVPLWNAIHEVFERRQAKAEADRGNSQPESTTTEQAAAAPLPSPDSGT